MASIIASNPHHRKIELQSPLDLTYLQNQLSTSARQKLDLHFPPTALSSKPATHISLGGSNNSNNTDDPSDAATNTKKPSTHITEGMSQDDEEETDPLRAHVLRLVTAHLSRSWGAAAQNISINGLDAHTLPQFTQPAHADSNAMATTASGAAMAEQKVPQQQEMEGVDFTYAPYDARLQGQLAELYGELEGLTAQVARLRREAPGKGAEAFRGKMGESLDREEGMYQKMVQRGSEAVEREVAKGKAKPRGLERYDEVRESYETATAELARLSGHGGGGGGAGGQAIRGGDVGRGALTGTVGKVQRARGVAEELE
jgi:kinetochor protein Mis14/NSL1